jgi:predicted phage terminase large subunit-like protein
LAVRNFRTFRQVKRPNLLENWYVADLSDELQMFYRALMAGERPKLAIEAPPQHGKSVAVRDFVSWFTGRHPQLKTIYASYSEDLGIAANADLSRTMEMPGYSVMFPQVRVGLPGYAFNTSHIEFAGDGGGGEFRNVTVEGPVNGMGLHLGVIDDPHKSRDEANRKSARDKVWNWLTDDFFPRFDASAGLLLIQTRWHVDDVFGRLQAKFGLYSKANPTGVRVLRYTAIAEENTDQRKKGDALFPQFKPIDFLLERKKIMSQASFEAEYQQHPIIMGGGVIPIEKIKVVSPWPAQKIVASVRYIDKAGTDDSDDAAYTAGVLMHKLKDHDPAYVISHVMHGRWRAFDRETQIKALAEADSKEFKNYQIVVEREPGSGGKESAENTIRNLAGYRVSEDRVTGSKDTRADPFVAQVQGGNVGIKAGEHVLPFLDECEPWPHGRFRDQVDAAAGAFNFLVKATSFNTNYEEWA